LTGIEPRKEEIFSAKTFAETGIHPYIVKSLHEQVSFFDSFYEIKF